MTDEYGLEAKFYDRIWGRYDYDADVKFLGELFQKNGCRYIIDVGCGTGNHAWRLSRMGYIVTGVDVSPTMIRIARSKDRTAKTGFLEGDMKALECVIPEGKRFDAAIALGQVSSHLCTNPEVQAFLKGIQAVLKKSGLFVFSARNATKINDEYLNKLLLDHIISEERLQLAILAQNSRDPMDPNTIIWRPIYLMKKNDRFDLQVREHRLRWFQYSELRRLLTENGFRIRAVHSGPSKEKFDELAHQEMWFVAAAT